MNPAAKDALQADVPPLSAKIHLKPYDYKLGILDNDGKKVRKIYSKAPGYIVYRTDNSIRLDIDDAHPKLEEYASNHYKLSVELAKIYSLLPEVLSHTESINRLVGRAITMNVAGHCDDAKTVLKQAEARLIKLNTIQGRLQYTFGAFFLGFVIFLISLFPSLSTFFGKSWQVNFHKDFQLFSNVILCGALGGILSIAISYRTLYVDIYADSSTNRLIGFSRIAIAAIASIFVFFAIKAKLVFAFVNEQPDFNGFYAFAMIAGFIEMFVPNIMNNLAKEAKVLREENAEPTPIQNIEFETMTVEVNPVKDQHPEKKTSVC
jgi:hypothetical protein